jgi:hypothetical protein
MSAVPSGFHLHPEIEKAVGELPCTYDFVVKKDHLFLRVPGIPLFPVAGRGLQRKVKYRTIKNAVSRIHRAGRAVSAALTGGEKV